MTRSEPTDALRLSLQLLEIGHFSILLDLNLGRCKQVFLSECGKPVKKEAELT